MATRVRRTRQGDSVVLSPVTPGGEEAKKAEQALSILIGRVCLSWNQAHYAVYHIFETITGTTSAWEIFWALKADSAQRDATLAAAGYLLVLQPEFLADLKKELKTLGNLAGERNALVHTPFGMTYEKSSGDPATWSGVKMKPIKPNLRLREDLNLQVDELEKKLDTITLRLAAIDAEIQRRISLPDKDPRQLGRPKANRPAGDPPSLPKDSEPPP